ncbi:hypothetical protein PG997_014698 [Apiospora hydei]|uniref:Uncharacterized protein n=1 Tax=Apiospora hydei TaxID=1337664 RepID=A0ABR1UX38_9PEZI
MVVEGGSLSNLAWIVLRKNPTASASSSGNSTTQSPSLGMDSAKPPNSIFFQTGEDLAKVREQTLNVTATAWSCFSSPFAGSLAPSAPGASCISSITSGSSTASSPHVFSADSTSVASSKVSSE